MMKLRVGSATLLVVAGFIHGNMTLTARNCQMLKITDKRKQKDPL